ncbi:WRKY transcription factor 4 [Castilleja foliolosa]|uniref:WRKY transcription factor 4 n=1 Tax=Castilleja foliolosa TaxID=1961234 RepID=A0ABD3DR61_9LAMI
MTLVSSFFAENDPDNDCSSFSQLLSGDMSSLSSAPSVSHNFEPTVETGGGGGGSGELRFQQNRPGRLELFQPPEMFTIQPGLSPASLVDSPSFFSSTQVPLFSHHHQQTLAQMERQYTLSSGAPPQQQQISPPIPNPKITKESSNVSHFYIKPADDGYHWRQYAQKLVQGSKRCYYKCTDQNCLVKKKVERSHDGQITGIKYNGQHNHPPPSKSHGNANRQGKSGFGSEGHFGNFGKEKGGRDQGSSQVTPEHISGLSDSEEVGNGETRLGGRDEDDPASKRRFVEVQSSKEASPRCPEPEPRVIIIEVTSEVDILDDGYKWQKYGQKLVKDNPHPRRDLLRYYKCKTPGCDVRKHIQRVADDPKDVRTTYRGNHNHDVPASKNSSRQGDAK